MVTTHLWWQISQCFEMKAALGKEFVQRGQTMLGFKPSDIEISESLSNLSILKMNLNMSTTR